MSAWKHMHKTRYVGIEIADSDYCYFCKNKLEIIFKKELKHKKVYHVYKNTKYIKMCPVCGWWIAIKIRCYDGENMLPDVYDFYARAAVLRKLDLDDISLPIDDVSQYLLAKYEDRFLVNPRLFEETVASAFRNMGYYARTTAYQNDGGIDVILDGKGNKTVGVQVKRYKNSIRVSQIREFAGALIENDMTKGIFVTTSKFQSGAYKSVSNFGDRGIGIELIDSERFYDALQIKRGTNNLRDEIIEEVSNIKLKLIYTTNSVTAFNECGCPWDDFGERWECRITNLKPECRKPQGLW